MSVRTYVRVASVAVIVAAAAMLAGPAVADAMRPTSGDVTVEFDSCARPSADFDGDSWTTNDEAGPALRLTRSVGRIETDGERGVLTVRQQHGAALRFTVLRAGFTNANACI